MAKKRRVSPTSKDKGQLSIQIDICADKIAELIAETRSKFNAAIVAGDLDLAERYDRIALQQAVQYSILIRHQIKLIDDSALMRDTIKGFVEINASIDRTTKDIEKLTDYVKAVTGIAATLERLIGKALVV